MLNTIKNHQRWIYIVVTFVVVISFSFFGISGIVQETTNPQKTAFISSEGVSVSQKELEAMMRFIATDVFDQRSQPYLRGINFLNDGVLAKEIFSTGAAKELIQQHKELFKEELGKKLQREKIFIPYSHPHLEAISAENIWQYFVPQIKHHFDKMRANNDPLSDDYLSQKIALYLSQKQLSAEQLRQILRYQQAQYQWLTPDPFLEQGDLSLFGYRNVEDWFGKRFLQLSAAFIINCAHKAENLGFQVTRNEAYADLLDLNAQSFQDEKKYAFTHAASSVEHFQTQLQALHMDKTQAIEIWRQVLLARKLLQNEQVQNLVSTFPWKEYQSYALKEKKGVKYLLPKDLQLQAHTYPLFETYVQTLASTPLSLEELPVTFKPVEALQQQFPELIVQTFSVKMRSAHLGEILGAIPAKTLFQWQISESGWKTLTAEYPELAPETIAPKERAKKLHLLDITTRTRIDQFSRKKVAETASTFIETALNKAPLEEFVWTLPLKGGSSPLEGFTSSQELIEQLQNPGKIAAKGGRYFLFSVEEISQPKIASYSEALKSGALKSLTDRLLKSHHKKIAKLKEKPFSEVESEVALSLYAEQTRELAKRFNLDPQGNEFAKEVARYRLLPFMEAQRKSIAKGNASKEEVWALEKRDFITSKAHPDEHVSFDASFVSNTCSDPAFTPNGQLYFYRCQEEQTTAPLLLFSRKIIDIQKKIGEEVSVSFMQNLVKEIKQKNGFAFTTDF